jgi:flagellar assembly protein FliH
MSIEVIPKERLTAFERWELGSFEPAAPAKQPASAGMPASEVKLPTAEDVERIHQEAHKAGYAAGYEEGTARARMEALKLHTVVENLDSALGTLDQSVADALLDLALELAQQMARHELQCKPEGVLDVVREVLQQLFHPHATIYLHPEDATLVRSFIGEQLNHAGHRIFEDPKLARGGCRVEAGGSQIDASIETRWRRISENIGRNASRSGATP